MNPNNTWRDPFDDDDLDPMVNNDGTLSREILWTSTRGDYVVVAGPFPQGFVRTTDAGSPDGASRKQTRGLQGLRSRKETARTDRYAKCRAKSITPTHNEYGEIAP